jgi:hypothetical protein
VEVEVEPLVLPAKACADVGGKPTAVADAGEAGRWGDDGGTPSGTLEEHYQMELTQPSSS